jgi:hypothetical protein
LTTGKAVSHEPVAAPASAASTNSNANANANSNSNADGAKGAAATSTAAPAAEVNATPASTEQVTLCLLICFRLICVVRTKHVGMKIAKSNSSVADLMVQTVSKGPVDGNASNSGPANQADQWFGFGPKSLYEYQCSNAHPIDEKSPDDVLVWALRKSQPNRSQPMVTVFLGRDEVQVKASATWLLVAGLEISSAHSKHNRKFFVWSYDTALNKATREQFSNIAAVRQAAQRPSQDTLKLACEQVRTAVEKRLQGTKPKPPPEGSDDESDEAVALQAGADELNKQGKTARPGEKRSRPPPRERTGANKRPKSGSNKGSKGGLKTNLRNGKANPKVSFA